MENNLEVINEQEVLGKQFRIYGTAEQPLFLAKDVAAWIEHSNPSKMIKDAELDENEKVTMRIGTLTNSYSALFLTEDGLYEVLMQSRKTGQYVVKSMDSYMIADPIERAKAWIKEEEKRIALANEVKELKPMAEQTEKFIERGHLIGIRALAKELNIKETKLRYIVNDVLGWRYKQGRGYKAYKWAVTKGFMETKDVAPGITRDYFTIKGRMRIEEELEKLNGSLGAA